MRVSYQSIEKIHVSVSEVFVTTIPFIHKMEQNNKMLSANKSQFIFNELVNFFRMYFGEWKISFPCFSVRRKLPKNWIMDV